MNGLINIGFGNVINVNKIVAIITSDSAPAKRMVQNGKDEGKVVDATQGRKTRSVIVTDSNLIVLSALLPDTIAERSRDLKNCVNNIEAKGDEDE